MKQFFNPAHIYLIFFSLCLCACGSLEISGQVNVDGEVRHVLIVCPDDAEGDPEMQELCEDLLEGKIEVLQE